MSTEGPSLAKAHRERHLRDQLAEALERSTHRTRWRSATVIIGPHGDRPGPSRANRYRGVVGLLVLGLLWLGGRPLMGPVLWLWALVEASRSTLAGQDRRSRSFQQVRARADRLELRIHSEWWQADWSEVTEAGDPVEWGELYTHRRRRAFRLGVAGYSGWLEDDGEGCLIGNAARLALAHYGELRRLAESVPQGALSVADGPDESDDRGLSRADA